MVPDAGPPGADDRGSALLLMPVAVLIVVLLGAIALDSAATFQAQREAVADAQLAADDAASALSAGSLRAEAPSGTGGPDRPAEPSVAPAALDRTEVDRRLQAALALRHEPGRVSWWIEGDEVVVVVEREVPAVLGGAVPGVRRRRSVIGRASAVLRAG